MRKIVLLVLAGGVVGTSHAQDSDSLGMIGDNLDLNAVLETFKAAESPEEFERNLNSSENKVNNLDLNQDGEVDYIMVIDEADEDAHALILRIATDESEFQDIAVIELEKTGDEIANIQIVGDEDLYGEDYIIEPSDEVTKGNMPPVVVVVNVWSWRCVRFIYGPAYKPWASPWGWKRHPAWWKPWRPYHWNVYHGFHKHHHVHYRAVKVHRMNRAHKVYHRHRKSWSHIQHHPHHHHHKGVKSTHPGKKGNHPGGKKGNHVQKRHGAPRK